MNFCVPTRSVRFIIAMSAVHDPAPDRDHTIAVARLVCFGNQVMVGLEPQSSVQGLAAATKAKPLDNAFTGAAGSTIGRTGASGVEFWAAPTLGDSTGRVEVGIDDIFEAGQRSLAARVGLVDMDALEVTRREQLLVVGI